MSKPEVGTRISIPELFGVDLIGEVMAGRPRWWTEEHSKFIFGGDPYDDIFLRMSQEHADHIGLDIDNLIYEQDEWTVVE